MSRKSSHGYHRFPKCRETGRVRFGERKDANLALKNAFHVRAGQRSRGEDITRREVAAYRCEHCRGWHVRTGPLRKLQVVAAAPTSARRRAAQPPRRRTGMALYMDLLMKAPHGHGHSPSAPCQV